MSGTRDYGQGGYSSNVYGIWGYSDASCTITASSSFTNRAWRGYGHVPASHSQEMNPSQRNPIK